jgi:uncharacterized membrane protein YeaQ/YmgE (transglycosylase-associated protein family)
MTTTLLSLISILVGIIGSNLTGYVFKKHSFGITGNTIAGVFGSIFVIKSFGRLGFNPQAILETGTVNYGLFTLNSIISFLSGAIAVILIYILKQKMT